MFELVGIKEIEEIQKNWTPDEQSSTASTWILYRYYCTEWKCNTRIKDLFI